MCHSTQNTILTKLSPWEYGNKDAPFHGENPAEFRVWCTTVHLQGFVLMNMARVNMLVPGWAGTPQSIKHVDTCRIHREIDVTWWHGLGQLHCGDYKHSMTLICTYNNRHERILLSQGPKHLWLERVTHVAMRVHHTKCTITHTRTDIYIYIHTYIYHAQCYHTEQESKPDITNVPRVWPNKVQEM